MTPTADILTQLVQNSRVTTNAISQFSLTQRDGVLSSSSGSSYEVSLSKALEGAVKMLGRPPAFGGGKTEVYDFMDFKEQLYNVLSYAEPKYAEAFRNLEKLGDHDSIPDKFSTEEQQAMSTKLYSLLSSWLTGTTKQHAEIQVLLYQGMDLHCGRRCLGFINQVLGAEVWHLCKRFIATPISHRELARLPKYQNWKNW